MYEFLFEAPGCGVWSLHDDCAGAQRHLNLLRKMTSGATRWSIMKDGVEVLSSKAK